MSDDMILHFSSNSSNQSDQSSKIAKLEARLVGKASSAVSAQPQVPVQLNSWTTPAKFGGASGGLPHSLVDSDDSDDDDHENLCPQNQRFCLRSISNGKCRRWLPNGTCAAFDGYYFHCYCQCIGFGHNLLHKDKAKNGKCL